MNTGKLVRMNRLFSHASGRLCSVAVDHFIGYGEGLPAGLRHILPTLAAVVAVRPDAVTMHKGIAASAWQAHAGRVPMIIQSTAVRPDDSAHEYVATPEDAVRLGADAFAVAAFVRGDGGGLPAGSGRFRARCGPIRNAGHLSHLSTRREPPHHVRSGRYCVGGPLCA